MSHDRTLYTITDELGERTTITIDKFVADILQESLSDVHQWVQNTYDRVVNEQPSYGRRQKGDMVRTLALIEALKTPVSVSILEEL